MYTTSIPYEKLSSLFMRPPKISEPSIPNSAVVLVTPAFKCSLSAGDIFWTFRSAGKRGSMSRTLAWRQKKRMNVCVLAIAANISAVLKDLPGMESIAHKKTDPSLDDLTIEGAGFARSLISDLALDVLLYQSAYREQISEIVFQESSRIHKLFMERNPGFNGKVHLIGTVEPIIPVEIYSYSDDSCRPFIRICHFV